MPKKAGGGTSKVVIKHSKSPGQVTSIAVRELAVGLGAMFGSEPTVKSDTATDAGVMLVSFGNDVIENPGPSGVEDDSFQISRPGRSALAIKAGRERGLLYAANDLMERLGARFIPGA